MFMCLQLATHERRHRARAKSHGLAKPHGPAPAAGLAEKRHLLCTLQRRDLHHALGK